MLRARLAGSELLARQGAMVAYQGTVELAYEGAGGVGRFLKKALTGEGVPLMRCRGTGDVFLAQDAHELHPRRRRRHHRERRVRRSAVSGGLFS